MLDENLGINLTQIYHLIAEKQDSSYGHTFVLRDDLLIIKIILIGKLLMISNYQ